MKRSQLMLFYIAVFRYLPIAIIALTALLWRVTGPKPAVAIGAALFAADAIALGVLAYRSGKGRNDGPDR